jgi:hypothetical protein
MVLILYHPHPVSHSLILTTYLYYNLHHIMPQGGGGRARTSNVRSCVVVEQQAKETLKQISRIQTYTTLTLHTSISLITPPTAPLKSHLYFYIEQLKLLSYIMQSFCFRVAEISFFNINYKFTTKSISHVSKLISHGLTTLSVTLTKSGRNTG